MKSFNIFRNIVCAGVAFLMSGCYFLDVSDELAGNLTKDQVFDDPAYTRRWHRNIFTGIPDYSYIRVKDVSGDLGINNPWAALCDELNFGNMTVAGYEVQGGFNASSACAHRWGTLYKLIRQANIFLAEAHVIPPAGAQIDFLDEKELKELIAQARFLRAFYYYQLFELYGPVPLVNDVLDPYEDNLDLPRNSVDEVVEFICSEMRSLVDEEGGLAPIETDENRLALPTKGVALAVIAKTRILAASPLFNGGYQEALALTNPDGKRLFPDADTKKWEVAKDAMEEFLKFAEGKYELYKEYKKDGSIDADKSLYEMFMKYNSEIIWASSKTFFNKLPDWGYDWVCTPFSEQKGNQTAAVMQELVDDFFMKDGLDIDESPLYKKEGFTKVDGQDIFNQWIDREPRFYQTVFYQGKKWQVKNNPIFFYYGSHNGADKTSSYPATGYLLFKRECRKLYNQGSSPKVQYRPSIIFRLADFYLLYAEVLNEIDPNDTRILEYIDKVRERAGIPLLQDIKPELKGDQEGQREAIRRERRVELCTEGGYRYFDVRRWMVAEKDGYRQGGDFYGMNMFGPKGDKKAFYEKVLVETRKFNKAMYLYPIPLNQIQISEQMVQNPGW